MKFKREIKKMDSWDIVLSKLASAAFILFLITIFPDAMDLVNSINPWYFFIALIIFAARPFYRVYLKR
jgi:hypothetical protein